MSWPVIGPRQTTYIGARRNVDPSDTPYDQYVSNQRIELNLTEVRTHQIDGTELTAGFYDKTATGGEQVRDVVGIRLAAHVPLTNQTDWDTAFAGGIGMNISAPGPWAAATDDSQFYPHPLYR